MDDVTRPHGGIDKTADNDGCSSARQNVEDDTINLADYLRVIIKHRRMIFWICSITVITTAIISMLLSKYYAATATVVPPVDLLQKESALLGSIKNPMLRQAVDVTSIADMYVGILKSRSVADALIERFDLATVYGIKGSVAGIRQVLNSRTSIKVGDEGIVSITVEDRDPCQAAALANAYVEELDRQNKRLFVGQAASKKVFLENRLKEIEQELSQIDNLLSRDAKIKEMLYELLTREFEIAKIEEAKSMPTIQVLDKAVVPEKKSKPERRKMVMLSAVIALLGGIFTAFAREYVTKVNTSC
jgi:tyrosine-protein kinase Etk/Wzc